MKTVGMGVLRQTWSSKLVGLIEGESFDHLYLADGRPLYIAGRNGKMFVVWGREMVSEGYDEICPPSIAEGKPFYYAKRDGKWFVVWDRETLSERRNDIGCLSIADGKPLYCVRRGGKSMVCWGTEVMGERYDIDLLSSADGKPLYIAERIDVGRVRRLGKGDGKRGLRRHRLSHFLR